MKIKNSSFFSKTKLNLDLKLSHLQFTTKITDPDSDIDSEIYYEY